MTENRNLKFEEKVLEYLWNLSCIIESFPKTHSKMLDSLLQRPDYADEVWLNDLLERARPQKDVTYTPQHPFAILDYKFDHLSTDRGYFQAADLLANLYQELRYYTDLHYSYRHQLYALRETYYAAYKTAEEYLKSDDQYLANLQRTQKDVNDDYTKLTNGVLLSARAEINLMALELGKYIFGQEGLTPALKDPFLGGASSSNLIVQAASCRNNIRMIARAPFPGGIAERLITLRCKVAKRTKKFYHRAALDTQEYNAALAALNQAIDATF